MKALTSVLEWADAALNGALIGAAGGVLLALASAAIEWSPAGSIAIVGLSATAAWSSSQIRL